jgi:hypothetical protein
VLIDRWLELTAWSIVVYCEMARGGQAADAREFALTQFNRVPLSVLAHYGLTTPAGRRLAPAAIARVLARIAAGRASC